MSYSNYLLNQKINNLQNQINNLDVAIDLQTVLDEGNTAVGSIELTDIDENALYIDPNSINMVSSTDGFSRLEYKKLMFVKDTSNATLEYTSSTDTLDITTTNINLNGQATFDTPPHSITPILGNDLTTKDYVDSLVGQYSGGYNLYLNYSETLVVNTITYNYLSNEVSSATQQDVLTITDGTDQLIATFITDEINILQIPTGLWNMSLYGSVSGAGGILYYYFKIKKNSGGVITDLITSGNSPDVNATPTGNPDVYHMNATIDTPINVLLTDRIIIEIYCIKVSGTSITLNTYFESTYYSFIQTTLNAGTTLLSSSNNWTGNNNFELIPTTQTATAGSNNTQLTTTAYIYNALLNYAPIASPTFTGTVNTTSIINSGTIEANIFQNTDNTFSASSAGAISGVSLSTSSNITSTGGYVQASSKVSCDVFDCLNLTGGEVSLFKVPTTRNISIANTQSTGSLFFASGPRSTAGSGTINFCNNGASKNNIYIGNGAVGATTQTQTYAQGTWTFSNAPLSVTPTSGDNSLKLSTTEYVQTALGSYLTTATASATYAPIASPTFTGVLKTSNNSLVSGRTASFDVDSISLPQSLSSATVNSDAYINIYGGLSPTGNYIILNDFSSGQRITIKNTSSFTQTIVFTTKTIILNTAGSGSSSVSLQAGAVLEFFLGVTNWIQINASQSMSLSSTLTVPTITSATTLSIGTTTATAITLGESAITTTINGKILATNVGYIGGGASFASSGSNITLSSTAGTYNNIYFFSGTGSTTQTITLPTTPVNYQHFIFRSMKTGGSFTIAGATTNIFLTGSVTSVASVALTVGNAISLFYNGTNWLQY